MCQFSRAAIIKNHKQSCLISKHLLCNSSGSETGFFRLHSCLCLMFFQCLIEYIREGKHLITTTCKFFISSILAHLVKEASPHPQPFAVHKFLMPTITIFLVLVLSLSSLTFIKQVHFPIFFHSNFPHCPSFIPE